MATIKEIQDLKQKDFVTVITDENSFVINKEVCINERLYQGKHLSPADLERILGQSENKTALNKALRYISIKKCSEKMMLDYLGKKGFSENACNYALSKLSDYRYIDDADYAASFVNFSGGKGRRKIAYELKNKGISEDIINNVKKDDDKEEADCKAAAEKFLKNKDIADPVIKQKLIRNLLYKGFEYEIILRVLAQWGESIET